MREVPLRSRKYPGLVALVDDEDYERVSRHTWWPAKRDRTFYAWTRLVKGDDSSAILLHRFIFPIIGELDHQDLNGLNCQKHNLRPATRQQQSRNRNKDKGLMGKPTTSAYKGVWKDSHNNLNPWTAEITVSRKRIRLGCFSEEQEAARAYDRAARKFFGEFAKTNFNERNKENDC